MFLWLRSAPFASRVVASVASIRCQVRGALQTQSRDAYCCWHGNSEGNHHQTSTRAASDLIKSAAIRSLLLMFPARLCDYDEKSCGHESVTNTLLISLIKSKVSLVVTRKKLTGALRHHSHEVTKSEVKSLKLRSTRF